MPVIQKSLVFSGKTATHTSPAIDVADAEAIALQIKAASIASGNGVFKLQGTIVDSPASTDWVDLVLVDNLAYAIDEGQTGVTSKTLSTNTSALLHVPSDLAAALKSVRVEVTVTTDGSYSAHLFAKRGHN